MRDDLFPCLKGQDFHAIHVALDEDTVTKERFGLGQSGVAQRRRIESIDAHRARLHHQLQSVADVPAGVRVDNTASRFDGFGQPSLIGQNKLLIHTRRDESPSGKSGSIQNRIRASLGLSHAPGN